LGAKSTVGNSIGKSFVLTCFGESHGKCVGAIIDGCPAGLQLSVRDIQPELDRRRPGANKISTLRREKDIAEILSGVYNGFTTGAPICILVQNIDVDSRPYKRIKDRPRLGHADYTARIRYGEFNDFRGGGRFSGRVTVAHTIAGAIAKKLLKRINVEVLAHTTQIGSIKLIKKATYEDIHQNVYKNPVRCANLEIASLMEDEVLKVMNEGNSLGGIIECIAFGVPAGLGDPIFDTLDADLAKMIFNIPAVKGVEIGAGFDVASLKGSENNDQFVIEGNKVVTSTNNAGGILGGLSTGMPIVVRAAFKPTSSITKKQKTVDLNQMKEVEMKLSGRYDPCIVPRAVPIVESCVSMVIVDHALGLGIIPKVLK
jgi:chorismate synthase